MQGFIPPHNARFGTDPIAPPARGAPPRTAPRRGTAVGGRAAGGCGWGRQSAPGPRPGGPPRGATLAIAAPGSASHPWRAGGGANTQTQCEKSTQAIMSCKKKQIYPHKRFDAVIKATPTLRKVPTGARQAKEEDKKNTQNYLGNCYQTNQRIFLRLPLEQKSVDLQFK